MLRYLLLISLFLLNCSCSQAPIQVDPKSAIQGHDLTSLLSGCGYNQIGIGYLACRMTEGDPTDESFIYIHAPPNLNCGEYSCLYYKIFVPREGGRSTVEGSIKRGSSFAKIPWSELTDKSTFDINDRGFFGVNVTLHYKVNGQPLKAYTNGYIFMHVTRRGYISLIESENNQNYVWQWVSQTGQTVKLTTGGRAYVSPYIKKVVPWLP